MNRFDINAPATEIAEDFIDYALSRDAGDKICHDELCGSMWGHCAVGEYVAERVFNESEVIRMARTSESAKAEFRSLSDAVADKLMTAGDIDKDYLLMYSALNNSVPHYYGELHRIIRGEEL